MGCPGQSGGRVMAGPVRTTRVDLEAMAMALEGKVGPFEVVPDASPA